ncbi:MAG: LuxR C-terminal-related transcriptional regulator [bacterium]
MTDTPAEPIGRLGSQRSRTEPSENHPLEQLVRGRDAFRRQAWREAYAEFVLADRAAPLDTEDVERSALAAHLIGRDADRDDRLARAHNEFMGRGDAESAARCAFWLGFMLVNSGEAARGSGWLARARRTLDEANCDSVVRGYLMLPVGIQNVGQGNADAAMAAFNEAVDIGRRFGDADLITIARLGQGRSHIRCGRVAEGVSLMDEVMVAVTMGELSPASVGGVYCSVLDGCHEIFDLRRAREWTQAFAEWCALHPDLVPFRGHCLIRRAEVMQLHGEWTDALGEAARACEQFADSPQRATAGAAYYRCGELHRLRGEFNEAEEAYRRANQCGRRPQPGLAQLRLAQNQADVAASAIRHVLGDVQRREMRSYTLHAAIDIMLAANDVAAARSAANELSVIAAELDAPYLYATASQGAGAVLIAEGQPASAMQVLRGAWSRWNGLEAPYEAARVRVLIGLAHRAMGDEESAIMEFDAARQTMQTLGAIPDVMRIDALSAPTLKRGGALTSREVEVLRLVATGQTNRAIAATLGISDKTVARHVSNLLGKLNLASRAGATAYAYDHSLLRPSPPRRST